MALLSTATDPAWAGISRKKDAAPAKDKFKAVPAHGDGIEKVKGSDRWPKHLKNPICRWGEKCHKYCYLTKDKPKFKP